jgi:hypothetical protein
MPFGFFSSEYSDQGTMDDGKSRESLFPFISTKKSCFLKKNIKKVNLDHVE